MKGNYGLSAFVGINKEYYYGELANMAELRIRAKDGMEAGTAVSGILTIKSGDKDLIVPTLTSIISDPCMTTKEIPQPVIKYVPYGTIIQNNNKYSWNETSYKRISGDLPKGMKITDAGEIYGVPLDAGDFTFTVRMDNSYSSFKSDTKTFTMT